ncbi:MAG TPA: thioredoxin domain-containing protein [Drouetiella sp.]
MPLKEMFVVFFAVLCVGALMNGMPKDEDPLRDAAADMQTGAATQKALTENPLLVTGTEDNFKDEVLGSQKPVLAVFYADSDPTCNKMAPVIAEIANAYQNTLKVVKIDVMTNASLYQKYEVGEMPWLIVFKNGNKGQAMAGMMTDKDLREFLGRSNIKPDPTPPSTGATPSG